MKKNLLLVLFAASIACSGCDLLDSILGSKEVSNHNGNNVNNNGLINPASNETTDGPIEGYVIKDEYIKVKIGNKSSTPTLDIYYKDGYNWEKSGAEAVWSIENTSIASVDAYGRVTGVSKGKTVLSFKTSINSFVTTVPVYVINSESDIQKSWKKMGANDEIKDKDSIIIACPQEGKAASISETGSKLDSVDITFTSDESEITDATGAAKYIVYHDGRGRAGYNFELPEREDGSFLGATNTKKVSYFDSPKSSQTVWEVSFNQQELVWDMRPYTLVDGWMMYNKDIQQFTIYQSNEANGMYVISLYRLTYTFVM